MRALVVHNFYRSANASGENLSVLDEIDALRALGWDIEVVSSRSDVIAEGAISRPELALRPIRSAESVRRVRRAIERHRPHVALVENVFPLHSPWVIRTFHQLGIPVAAAVRSYRNWCVAATHFRAGSPCHDCLGSRVNLPAVLNACYQESRAASLAMAASLTLHRRTWPLVDRFLVVSNFVGDYLRSQGIDPDRITVRPNFVRDLPHTDPGSGFVFAGRLTEEKGVGLLLDAWRRAALAPGHTLTLAGSGPLEGTARDLSHLGVRVLGLVPNAAVIDELRKAAVTVIPSIWDEPFGRGVIEAASLGRAAIVTDRGALPETVVDGVSGWVAGVDADELAAALRAAADPTLQAQFGAGARSRFESHYTEEVSVGVLHEALGELAEATRRKA